MHRHPGKPMDDRTFGSGQGSPGESRADLEKDPRSLAIQDLEFHSTVISTVIKNQFVCATDSLDRSPIRRTIRQVEHEVLD